MVFKGLAEKTIYFLQEIFIHLKRWLTVVFSHLDYKSYDRRHAAFELRRTIHG